MSLKFEKPLSLSLENDAQLLQVKHILLQSSDHPADPIPGPFVRVTHLQEGPMLLFFLL
jgi:hypothetical protein